MHDLLWRTGFTLLALAILACVASGAGCGASHVWLEQLSGQTPQAQVGRYLQAVAQGDLPAALALWAPPGPTDAALAARRQSITGELLAYGPDLEYRILDVTWWRTCCEPGRIEDASQAGLARFEVAVGGEGRPEQVYVFDLLVPGGYWGDAAGNPVRTWQLVDVYPRSQVPLVWIWP
jgi:hypothetical protein